MVREERNHPSIMIWSLENEITFINSRNLGLSKDVEPDITRAAKIVMDLDPTRPVMVDGGNCLMDHSLPVNGVHYIESYFRDYPDEAYTLEKAYIGHEQNVLPGWGKSPWQLMKDRPTFMGEMYFIRGYTSAAFSQLGGEGCFAGWSHDLCTARRRRVPPRCSRKAIAGMVSPRFIIREAPAIPTDCRTIRIILFASSAGNGIGHSGACADVSRTLRRCSMILASANRSSRPGSSLLTENPSQAIRKSSVSNPASTRSTLSVLKVPCGQRACTPAEFDSDVPQRRQGSLPRSQERHIDRS